MARRVLLATLLAMGLLAISWLMLRDRRDAAPSSKEAGAVPAAAAEAKPLHGDSRTVSPRDRAEAIARAKVWRAPAVPIAQASLGQDVAAPQQIECRFKIGALGGTTPKFHCVLPTGREIRTKYGQVPEIPAEAAATRLLTALGFGADRITLVERLRCYGCPKAPFLTMKVVEKTGTRPAYERVIDHQDYEEFEWVAIENKFEARPIESEQQKGWAFYELDNVDESKGGAARTHVDALRLMAVFLAHWDNKAENQRLVCLSRSWSEGAPCGEPFLILQDVGATFGPKKVDLDGWERAAVWDDRAACRLSMKGLPYYGGTFGTPRVSEAGRQFLAGLLGQLTDAQLAELFSAARFDKHHGLVTRSRPVSEWVRVFKKRLEAISAGPACPAV
jgi:hypothetical protein